MSSTLKLEYVNRTDISSKTLRCISLFKQIIRVRSWYFYLCMFIPATIILYFLSQEEIYIGLITSISRVETFNTNGVPLPSSFSSHYSLYRYNDPFNIIYSSFQCLNGNPSDMHTENSWHERSCIFHNVCLQKDGRRNNYFIDYFYPSTMEPIKPTLIRHNDSVLLSLRHGSRLDSRHDLSVVRIRLISLNNINASATNTNIAYLNGTYLMYQILAEGDMNFGHFIFDDVFGLYSNLKQFRSTRFNSPRENYVLGYKLCSSFTKSLQDLCVKFTEGIFPVITANPIRSIDSLLDISNRTCFQQLIAGHGLAGAVGWNPKNTHRARIFDEFRSDLLSVYGINSRSTPLQHHIALIQKFGRRRFTNLDEIYKEIQAAPQYRDIKATIFSDFVNLTVADQLRMFQNFTIVISPCGGISLLFSFLPLKSTLIVSEYPTVTKTGYSGARMEAAYWDYQSHLNVLHYPIDSVDDFELETRFKKDNYIHLRNYADINLKIEKLFPLIDRAIIRATLKY